MKSRQNEVQKWRSLACAVVLVALFECGLLVAASVPVGGWWWVAAGLGVWVALLAVVLGGLCAVHAAAAWIEARREKARGDRLMWVIDSF